MTDGESPLRTLTSGEMVRASGLSIKALRLYDSNGLLVPAHVDPHTGYRHYAVEQVERARQIAVLRRLDLTLARIAEVLDAPAHRARTLLVQWWVERRDQLTAQRQTAIELMRSWGGENWHAGPAAAELQSRVRTREVPEAMVATMTSTASQADLVPTFTADVLTIRRHLEQVGATAGAGHWVIYHQPPLADVPGQVETCVPYTGSAVPGGDIVLRVDAARTERFLDVPVRDCVFPRIIGYHEAVGAEGAPPTREVYRGAWSDDEDEIVAEVAAPVRAA